MTLRKARGVLDNLKQSIDENLRCAYPSYSTREESMQALAQILEHFPMVRGLLDEVEAEVLKCFVDAPADEARAEADRAPACLGSATATALIINGEEGPRCFGPFESHEEAEKAAEGSILTERAGGFWTLELEEANELY
jgi:hypothetical protein